MPLYNLLMPHVSFQDDGCGWEVRPAASDADPIPSPMERLRHNDRMTFDQLQSYFSLNPDPEPARTAPSNDDEAFALVVEGAGGTTFELRRGEESIAMAMLSRPFLRPGEVVHLHLNFNAASLTTFQVIARLEDYEEVQPHYSVRGGDTVWEAPGKTLGYAEEIVWLRDRTSFSFSIPLTALPTCYTSACTRASAPCMSLTRAPV